MASDVESWIEWRVQRHDVCSPWLGLGSSPLGFF